MQAALDATALMLSKTASSLSSDQIPVEAKSYFLANFNRPEAKNVQLSASYTTTGGSSVLISGSADMDTEFIGILGYKTITITGTSTAKWGSARLRVALVLDTTGSMNSDDKIGALKTATKKLLTQLEGAAGTDGDVYVSIIPFSKNVNLNSANYSADWIDWTDWEAEPAAAKTWITNNANTWANAGPGDSCPFTNNTHGFVCAPNPTSTSTTSTIPSSGTYAGYICPATDSGKVNSTKIGIMYNGCYNSVQKPAKVVSTGWSASCSGYSNCTCSGWGSSKICTQTYPGQYNHTWIKNARSTWNGCITDRGNAAGPSQDYDRLATAPSTSITETLFPAEQNFYCSPKIIGLNYDWSTMKTQVESLYPLGATNQPIGLVWGWQSLVGGGPLSAPSKDSNYTYSDIIILLSDGLNTLNRWYGNGSSTNTSVDARMYDSTGKGTCANIKAAGITIYAIHVNTGGDPTSTLLKNCASSTDKFFLLTSASQIITTFDAIGTNLTKLRIAQ
jgi:hypothetical protein